MQRALKFIILLLSTLLYTNAATLVSSATGNFTAAGTWKLANSTAELYAATSQACDTTVRQSSSFIPGAITVDGMAVYIQSKPGSTGTVTITLRNVTTSTDIQTVVANVTDYPTIGWQFLGFGSTLLVAGEQYAIRASCSNNGQLNLFRDATLNNWARELRTTTTQAPAVNDRLFITGEVTGPGAATPYTVTMDNTAATEFGPAVSVDSIIVTNNGTLTWGTTASTNYVLNLKGHFEIFSNAVVNIGTVGTRIPATSTATIAYNLTGNIDSGTLIQGSGVLNAYGADKTSFTRLTANIVGGNTIIQLGDTTGWLAGDIVCIAATTRTAAQQECATILTVDSATQITLTAGVANSHSGTVPTQAHVANTTRNIKIRGESGTLQSFVLSSGNVTLDSVVISWMGSGTGSRRGFDNAGGTTTFTNVVADNFVVSAGRFELTSGTFTADRFVTAYINSGIIGAGATVSISNSLLMRATNQNLLLQSGIVTLSNVVSTSSASAAESIFIQGASVTCTNIESYSNNAAGFRYDSGSASVTTASIWRNNGYGMDLRSSPQTVTGLTLFGNSGSNIIIGQGGTFTSGLVITNSTVSSDATFSTAYGFRVNSSYSQLDTRIYNTTFGTTQAHTTGDIFLDITTPLVTYMWLNNVTLTTGISGYPTNMRKGSFIRVARYQQINGQHRSYLKFGIIEADSVVFNDATPSERLTPNSASTKLISGFKQAALQSGSTATVSVWVRKSIVGDGANYNGAEPRLIVKANPAIGINTDTVLDTMSVGLGTWELLSGTTAAATDDGVFEFYIDCDGTTGWVNDDDWSVNGLLISTNRPWWFGMPMLAVGGEQTGAQRYWSYGLPAESFTAVGSSSQGLVLNNPVIVRLKLSQVEGLTR